MLGWNGASLALSCSISCAGWRRVLSGLTSNSAQGLSRVCSSQVPQWHTTLIQDFSYWSHNPLIDAFAGNRCVQLSNLREGVNLLNWHFLGSNPIFHIGTWVTDTSLNLTWRQCRMILQNPWLQIRTSYFTSSASIFKLSLFYSITVRCHDYSLSKPNYGWGVVRVRQQQQQHLLWLGKDCGYG